MTDEEILKRAAQIRGRKGGQKSSKRKTEASRLSLEKARKVRAAKYKAKLSKT